jgi:hypothetical protein
VSRVVRIDAKCFRSAPPKRFRDSHSFCGKVCGKGGAVTALLRAFGMF